MENNQTAAQEALFIIAILRCIPRFGWITTRAIKASLEARGIPVPTRKLQRALKAIVETPAFQVEVNTLGRPYGYRQRFPDQDLLRTNLKPDEGLLVRLSEEYLRHQLPSSLLRSLRPFFDTARSTLGENSRASRERAWLKKVAFCSASMPMKPPAVKSGIFEAVSEALYSDAKLLLSYHNGEGEGTSGIVSPLGLVEQDHRLYLVCIFDGYTDVRHLALHRMHNAKLLEAKAERPEGFSLDRYVRSRHFNYGNGETIRLAFDFTSERTANILAETPFSNDQELRFDSVNQRWHLEATVQNSRLLDGWLAMWGPEGGITNVTRTPVETPSRYDDADPFDEDAEDADDRCSEVRDIPERPMTRF